MSIKIENTQVFGWEAAIRGARNPMNSWKKSDTKFVDYYDCEIDVYRCHNITGKIDRVDGREPDETYETGDFLIGPNDYKLLMNLCKGGTEEAKWRRMVHVQMDITAPLYWWKEFETYKVGTVSNSCSTIHKIAAKELTMEDFSCEHLLGAAYERVYGADGIDECGLYLSEIAEYMAYEVSSHSEVVKAIDTVKSVSNEVQPFIYPEDQLKQIVKMLNCARKLFLETKDKRFWWQMIQLLPASYNQRRTIDLNYEVLASQYRQRKNHKLDEWREYCEWIETLPYSEFITLKEKVNE